MNRLILLACIISFIKTEAQPSVLNMADSLFVNGNFSEAIKNYKLHTNSHDVSYKLARSYQAIGNYDEALTYYKNSIQLVPNNALAAYEYAKLLAKTKKYEAAASVFKNLIVTDSLHPNYHYELGLVYEQLDDSLAHSEYKKSFQLDPEHQKAIFKLAKRELQIRRYDSVVYYVETGLKTYENNSALINLKAQSYYFQKDYKKAAIWFEKLLELGENSQFVHEKLS